MTSCLAILANGKSQHETMKYIMNDSSGIIKLKNSNKLHNSEVKKRNGGGVLGVEIEAQKTRRYTKQRAAKKGLFQEKVVECCEETNVPLMEVSWV